AIVVILLLCAASGPRVPAPRRVSQPDTAGTRSAMRRLLAALDKFQQRHRALAFPIAVYRKFSDDQAGSLAALVSYYAFVSTFPLLLVLVTVLGMVLSGSPRLQQDVLNSALSEFPVIGQQLR